MCVCPYSSPYTIVPNSAAINSCAKSLSALRCLFLHTLREAVLLCSVISGPGRRYYAQFSTGGAIQRPARAVLRLSHSSFVRPAGRRAGRDPDV